MEIVGSLSGDVAADQQRDRGPQRLAGLYGARRPLQRPRHVHRHHRLRMDRDRRLQPAPQRDLPRRRRRRRPDAALLAVRQQEPRRPVDLHGRLRGRRPASEVLAIPHNGNLSNGRMFTVESFDGKPLTPRARRPAHPVRAADRDHPDQGRRRGAPVPLAQRRVRRLRDLGQVATSTAPRPRPRTC